MGHRKKSAPKRGSLAYLPRGRAARESGRIRYWPPVNTGPKLLSFAGYKAGMTHLYYIEDHPRLIVAVNADSEQYKLPAVTTESRLLAGFHASDVHFHCHYAFALAH